MTNTDKKQWKVIAVLAGLWIIAAVALVLVLNRTAIPPAPVVLPDPVGESGETRYFGGWHHDPEAVAAVQATLADKRFADTPAFRAFRGADTGTVLLSDSAKAALGHHIPTRNQGGVGSCVSFGTVAAVEHLICVQIVEANKAGQPPPAFHDLVQEAVYGLSRVEIGGGKIRGDGSVTAWAGDAVRKYGVIPRGPHGALDLSRYDETRCRQWGSRGLPDDLEPVARESPVRGITLARTAKEVDRAIRQGYAVAVGSGIGFGNRGPYTRDKDGFLRASGQWGHCMAVIGVKDGKRPGFLFLNSWGEDWVSGPTGGHDIPPGSFWVDYPTADRMFAEGDCVIFSDAAGFPARDPLDDFDLFGVVPRIAPVDRAVTRIAHKRGASCSLAF